MLETILEKIYNNFYNNSHLHLQEEPRSPSGDYNLKYMSPKLQRFISYYREETPKFKCIPWPSPIDICALSHYLERAILVITEKNGDFTLNRINEQFFIKNNFIYVYQDKITHHYYFLLFINEDSSKISKRLNTLNPYTQASQNSSSFYYFYIFAGITVIIALFAFYCFERKDHLNKLNNDLAILNHNLKLLLESLNDWEKNIIYKNNKLISLGGFDFTENIQHMSTKCRTFVANNQDLIAKIFPSLIISFDTITSSFISLANIISSIIFKPSFDVDSVDTTIKECHAETLQLTKKIETAICNLSDGVVKKLSESAENNFTANTFSEVSNLFYWLIGISLSITMISFIYFRFNKPTAVSQLSPVLQQSPNMTNELKYGNPISPELRQKMIGSPKLSTLITPSSPIFKHENFTQGSSNSNTATMK